MHDIDSALRRLAEAPLPARVAGLETEVLKRTKDHRFERKQRATTFRFAAVALALIMGIAGGIVPGRSASAEDLLLPISDAVKLAPSTLLLGDW